LLGGAAAASFNFRMPSERPNLLLVTTDQQRFDALAAAGNGSIFTPRLNWLWRTGTAFENGYKYHFSVYGGGELLFDLTTDPREERNLADDPDCAERKAAMRAALVEELQEAPGECVAGGDLVIQPAIEDEDGLRAAYGEWVRKNAGKWPGLHTPSDPSDVLH